MARVPNPERARGTGERARRIAEPTLYDAAMRASLLVVVSAVLISACGGVPKEKRLDFATVQTLNPGVDGRWVLEEFPQASGVQRDASGKIRRLSYGVTDPQGKPQTLDLVFDENEILVRKDYSGRLLRPNLPTLTGPREVQTQPGRGAAPR
jgi:hypothetical protein